VVEWAKGSIGDRGPRNRERSRSRDRDFGGKLNYDHIVCILEVMPYYELKLDQD